MLQFFLERFAVAKTRGAKKLHHLSHTQITAWRFGSQNTYLKYFFEMITIAIGDNKNSQPKIRIIPVGEEFVM
jgi:hypothetical protein